MAIENGADDSSLPSSTELAFDHTLLALDRTLMAWVRTAISLISFGLAIYKFFQRLREHEGLEPDGRALDSRMFAMLMISNGPVSLPPAIILQLQLRKKLKRIYPEAGFPLATIMAAFISLLGILALIAVIFGNNTSTPRRYRRHTPCVLGAAWQAKRGDRRIYVYQRISPSRNLFGRHCSSVTGLNRYGPGQAHWPSRPIGGDAASNLESISPGATDA
jgi:putative membrane protein